MIPTEDEEVLWVLDLVREEQADGFKGLLAPVDVVPKEEVVCFGWEPSVFKEAEKIVILAMDITTNLRQKKQCVSAGLGRQANFVSRTVEELDIP